MVTTHFNSRQYFNAPTKLFTAVISPFPSSVTINNCWFVQQRRLTLLTHFLSTTTTNTHTHSSHQRSSIFFIVITTILDNIVIAALTELYINVSVLMLVVVVVKVLPNRKMLAGETSDQM